MTKRKLICMSILAATAAIMTSCGTTETVQPLYSWYKYEDLTYKYSKVPSTENYAAMMEEYKKMETQKGERKVVPPGFNAEYGYLLFKAGKNEEALKYLSNEILLYPESKEYIGRIIKQIQK